MVLTLSCQTNFNNKFVSQTRIIARNELIAVQNNTQSHITPERPRNDEPIVSHKDTFPLTFVASGDTEYIVNEKIEKILPVGVAEAKFFTKTDEKFESFGIFLAGKDGTGKKWEVDLSDRAIGLGYHSYIADFDNNGIKDFLFVTYTGGNGFLPNLQLRKDLVLS